MTQWLTIALVVLLTAIHSMWASTIYSMLLEIQCVQLQQELGERISECWR